VSRGYIATIETGRANPTLDVVERLGHSLGVDLTLTPTIAGVAHLRQRDLVHVRCSSAVHRRLTAAGLECRREVAFSDGRVTGWIDLTGLLDPRDARDVDVLNGIAYDSERGRLFVTGKRWPTLFEIELVLEEEV